MFLYGQKTSDPNTCQTGILDHANDFDFSGGRKVFDGRKDDGQKDENEISMLGSCYEVKEYPRILFQASQAPLNAQLEGGLILWESSGTWKPHPRNGVCVSWRHLQSLAVACDIVRVGVGEPHFPQTWKLVDCGQLSNHRFKPQKVLQ